MGFLLLAFIYLYLDTSASVEISACYGTISPNILEPNCTTGEILRVNGLYTLSKLVSTGCPAERHAGAGGDPAVCCTESPDDCKMDYQGSSQYFSVCVSKETCVKLAAWQQTTCNGTGFHDESSAMLLDYTCIPRHDILPITSDAIKTGSTSTIGGPDYPITDLPANQDGVCSVSASCTSGISVVALDLDFKKDGSTTCRQYIDIEDGSNSFRIDCNSNNPDFKPAVLYTSQSHFIVLRFENTLTTTAGRLWLELKGSYPDAEIDIRCGTSALSTAPSVSGCLQTTTLPPVPTSTSALVIDSNSSSTASGQKRRRDDDDGGDSLGTDAIIAIVICLIILIVLILIIALWRYKKSKKGMMNLVSSETHILPDDEFAAALGLTGSKIVPGVAPVSSTIGQRPPRLTPIETTPGGKHGKPAWGQDGMKPSGTIVTPSSTLNTNSSNGGSIKTNVFEIDRD